MAVRIGLVLLLVALAVSMVANASPTFDSAFGISTFGGLSDGKVGDLIDLAEEEMMESESARRTLAQDTYISYEALKKNIVPCNRRGASYYACSAHEKVNPYTRGCSRLTLCARNTQ